jgi:EAL domain-containing protein (putative c-di-GMP-specific phosphodiesterase class I)
VTMIPGKSAASAAPRRAATAVVPSPGVLDAAIERGGLHPFFQAKFSTSTGAITGAEALARIATPRKALAAPGPYVELAERHHRIDALTFAMTRAVAKCVAAFNTASPALPCAINISPVSLDGPDFPDLMAGAVHEAGLACGQFTLELTEARQIEYGPRALETMAALRTIGFGLSVDDFGAGQSNIDRLKAFPFTEVKIDAAFTRMAMDEAFAKAAMLDCVKTAKDAGLRVVAKGVETREMLEFLRSAGVNEVQGFLLSRPMPAAAFQALLAEPR